VLHVLQKYVTAFYTHNDKITILPCYELVG